MTGIILLCAEVKELSELLSPHRVVRYTNKTPNFSAGQLAVIDQIIASHARFVEFFLNCYLYPIPRTISDKVHVNYKKLWEALYVILISIKNQTYNFIELCAFGFGFIVLLMGMTSNLNCTVISHIFPSYYSASTSNFRSPCVVIVRAI